MPNEFSRLEDRWRSLKKMAEANDSSPQAFKDILDRISNVFAADEPPKSNELEEGVSAAREAMVIALETNSLKSTQIHEECQRLFAELDEYRQSRDNPMGYSIVHDSEDDELNRLIRENALFQEELGKAAKNLAVKEAELRGKDERIEDLKRATKAIFNLNLNVEEEGKILADIRVANLSVDTGMLRSLAVRIEDIGPWLKELFQLAKASNLPSTFKKKLGDLGRRVAEHIAGLRNYLRLTFGFAIVDDKEAQEERRALFEKLEQMETANRSKTEFLANISHEIRGPLNTIVGFSEILSAADGSARERKERSEYVKGIQESAMQLVQIANDVLDVSKIELKGFTPNSAPIAVRAMLENSVKAFKKQADERRIDLSLDVSGDLPTLYCDKRHLQQIVSNLLSNAIKFTMQNGTVKVSALALQEGLEICVQDTGIGISTYDLDSVTQPFFGSRYTSKDSEPAGVGLGLSIVKGLVDIHGGELSITSNLGEGTTVTVRLPNKGN